MDLTCKCTYGEEGRLRVREGGGKEDSSPAGKQGRQAGQRPWARKLRSIGEEGGRRKEGLRRRKVGRIFQIATQLVPYSHIFPNPYLIGGGISSSNL